MGCYEINCIYMYNKILNGDNFMFSMPTYHVLYGVVINRGENFTSSPQKTVHIKLYVYQQALNKNEINVPVH